MYENQSSVVKKIEIIGNTIFYVALNNMMIENECLWYYGFF